MALDAFGEIFPKPFATLCPACGHVSDHISQVVSGHAMFHIAVIVVRTGRQFRNCCTSLAESGDTGGVPIAGPWPESGIHRCRVTNDMARPLPFVLHVANAVGLFGASQPSFVLCLEVLYVVQQMFCTLRRECTSSVTVEETVRCGNMLEHTIPQEITSTQRLSGFVHAAILSLR